VPPRSADEVARTRRLWAANKPGETAAPAYTPDPPVAWHVAAALGLALLLQAEFAPFVAFRGASPSLVTLLVAWYAVRTGSLRGLLFGLIAGAAEDAIAGSTGVAWTFATGLAGLAAGRLARTWLADTQLALVPGAAVVTLLRYGAFAIGMQLQGMPLALPLAHLHAALWQSLLDALVAFVALRAGTDLGGRVANRR
jgi:cell shape-determining protein MreD